ncbi:MAG: hypothetical protein ACRYF3_12880 [Janthinobacterium lividum]
MLPFEDYRYAREASLEQFPLFGTTRLDLRAVPGVVRGEVIDDDTAISALRTYLEPRASWGSDVIAFPSNALVPSFSTRLEGILRFLPSIFDCCGWEMWFYLPGENLLVEFYGDEFVAVEVPAAP